MCFFIDYLCEMESSISLFDIYVETILTVKRAGVFLKDQIGKVQASDIIEKEKNSLVSYVDLETEKILVQGLQKILPQSSFLTEENTAADIKDDNDWKWIIDPLDGTTNFLRGIPMFCISVALVYRDELKVGVIYDVNRDECFSAYLGGGAFLNNNPISISNTKHLQEAVIATGFPYSTNQLDSLVALLRKILQEVRGVRRLGSAALDLAYTACGRFDAYYELRINPWDVAAGILIVEEAGGTVSNIFGQKNPLYSKNILASNGDIHDAMYKLIEEVGFEKY